MCLDKKPLEFLAWLSSIQFNCKDKREHSIKITWSSGKTYSRFRVL